MTSANGSFARAKAPHHLVFGRMGRNVAWLSGGRGFQALASIFYLALAARRLGPHGFGEFSLALAYGQAIANLAQFQSWQSVIRYGSIHIARRNAGRLARLLGFTATLDAASALLGALLALIGVWLLGPWLGWSIAEQRRAALFGAALLLSIGATPTGILRLLDRFDLIAWCQAIGPATRLIGSILALWWGGNIAVFLGVWAGAALLQSGVSWWVAVGQSVGGFAIGRGHFGRAVAENEGIWRFMLVTNASSSLGLLIEQVGTLAVGGVAGATAAGGFRLASKLAKALARPVQTMARVLYPELARLVAGGDDATLARVMRRTSRVAALLAIAVVAITAVGGDVILRSIAGRPYGFARPILLLMAIAAALDLSGFAFEPLLAARGEVGAVLRARLAGGLVYAALLAALLPPAGAMGASVAAVGASLVVRLLLGRLVSRRLVSPAR